MNDEASFLRAILAAPQDDALKSVYADWLEERGDPRAGYLRDGGDPAAFDPGWVAFLTTLARPFEPYHFESDPAVLPFKNPIGRRGGLVTFAGQFSKESAWDDGLMRDLGIICSPRWGECSYGAASCDVYPFLCELPANRRPLFASDVLSALKASDFRSQHIPALDVPAVAYPGYHPGTENDEIHTDFDGQYLFAKRYEDIGGDQAGPIDERSDNHGVLKRHVGGGQLWYVLLHTREEWGRYVILFAVGASPHGKRLVGVATHQVCHNLCD
jgi:uncharacterized protein (TIGR02996 family)